MWAVVTPFSESYSSTSTADGWTTSVSGRFTPVILNEDDNYYLSVTQDQRKNNGCIVTGSIISGKAAAGDDFTLTFDMRLSNSNNQEPVELAIKDAANSGVIFSLSATAKNATTWKVNGQTLQLDLPNSGAGKGVTDITWISYKISRSGSLTYLTVTNKENSDVILARQTIDGASATGGLGNIVFTTKRYNANFAIDNIEVRALQDGDVPVVTPVDYTIKYVDESSNSIADDVVINSYVGAEVTASAAQMAAIYKDTKKYIYKSGNEAITLGTEAASNVITLVFREAAIYGYTINATYDGKVIETIESGSSFEGDNVSFIYKHYYSVAGALIKKDAGAYVKNELSGNVTPNADGYVASVEYADAGKTDIVFMSEAEDIPTLTAVTSAYLPARFSGGKGGYAKDEDQIITTLPAGKYKLTAHIMGTASACTFTFKAGAVTVWENATNSDSFYPGNGITGDEFTLTETTDIILVAAGGDGSSTRVTNCVDFIYIERTDAPQTVTIGADGFASFSSAKALDFTGTTIKAYVATAAADGVVTMSRVNKVPANTGLIIQGTTASVPVVDGEAETISTNLLKPGTGANVAASTEGTYHYVFAKQSDKFGFYNLTADTKVEKGKAYLETTTALTAEARLVFVDETTGIANVNSQMNDVKSIFNLNGQRVEKAQKGLFIINGKKVLVK